MPNTAAQTINLASRDSLLAMAQTIAAAHRLAAAGFSVRIRSLKTSGDLKLDAALYTVASSVPAKEGRAFFTKELDEALLSGKADAAVHSFKDLPYESVPGIADPILFLEQTGADLLVLRKGISFGAQGKGLIIGTSSLRRIHQLQLTMPDARTQVLRGNVVTRLSKLEMQDRGINAILIAGAGLRRLEEFASTPETYSQFLEPDSLAHIRSETARFNALPHSSFEILELSEAVFPTAPGQGVLAFQLSMAAAEKLGSRIKDIFPEHAAISARAQIERQIMRSLETGCHAPLGVSALRENANYAVHACFSRKSTTEPVSFADSVYVSRRTSGDSEAIVREIRTGNETAFWWGSLPTPETRDIYLVPVRAFSQIQLTPACPEGAPFAAIFAASPAVLPWLRQKEELHSAPVWAAGRDTLRQIRADLPGMKAHAAGQKGFSAALAEITQRMPGKILWLGSKTGLSRAQRIAGAHPVDFLPVYDNIVLPTAEIVAQQPQLASAAATALHLVASAAAAQALVAYMQATGAGQARVSCFGESAADVLTAAKVFPYHVSHAQSFAEYLEEICGSTQRMEVRLPAHTGS